MVEILQIVSRYPQRFVLLELNVAQRTPMGKSLLHAAFRNLDLIASVPIYDRSVRLRVSCYREECRDLIGLHLSFASELHNAAVVQTP